jgi:ParB-like chromosome segregation protein Spo0J
VSISHRNSKDKAATPRISALTIGVRHRRDLGDIEGLAASIAEVWLLQPVVITPGKVLIKRAIEPIERAEAKERQAAADKAAKATGKARHTHDKAEAIVAAAEAAPDEFGKLLADIDRTGRHRDRSGT